MENTSPTVSVLSDTVSSLGKELAQLESWSRMISDPEKTVCLVTKVVAQYVACSAAAKEMEVAYAAGLAAWTKLGECEHQQELWSGRFSTLVTKPLPGELGSHAVDLQKAVGGLVEAGAALEAARAEHQRAVLAFDAAATKWIDLAQFPSGNAVCELRAITGKFVIEAPEPEMFELLPARGNRKDRSGAHVRSPVEYIRNSITGMGDPLSAW